MAKLLLRFACIIVANVILSNAQQNASSNETNQSLLLSVQMHSQTSGNNITNAMQHANNTFLPVETTKTATTTTNVLLTASPSSGAFINGNITPTNDNGNSSGLHENGNMHYENDANNRNSVLHEEIRTSTRPTPDVNDARSTTTINSKFEEFTLAPQLIANGDSVTGISIDDIEPVYNIDTRNIYKIAKHKSAKLMPPKRHIAETVHVPFKSDSRNSFHHYDVTRKFDGADPSHLNIFQIITDLYDQSEWKINAITKRVNEICSADMEMYLNALGTGEPWAVKGKFCGIVYTCDMFFIYLIRYHDAGI